MKSTRIFISGSWLIVAIEAVAAFGYHYAPAVPGFWVAVVCAIFITIAEWRWSRRLRPDPAKVETVHVRTGTPEQLAAEDNQADQELAAELAKDAELHDKM